MTPALARDVTSTYRYLRGTIIALLIMLVVAVTLQTMDSGCLLGSISSYYFTPVRAVFVGSLFALGAALIAYKGHDGEDVLLNFSGFMAFVVAMVPTVPDTSCESGDPGSTQIGFTMTDAEIARAVTNNIWSLIVVTVLAVVAVVIIRKRSNPKAGPDELISGLIRDPASRTQTTWITIVCGAVLVAELWLFLALPDRFIALSHGIAASTMVLGVIAVMLFNLKQVSGRQAAYKRIYLVLAIALAVMLALAVWAAWTWRSLDHVILIVELVVIADFIAYWGVQTWELRGSQQDSPKAGVGAG